MNVIGYRFEVAPQTAETYCLPCASKERIFSNSPFPDLQMDLCAIDEVFADDGLSCTNCGADLRHAAGVPV